MGKNAMATTGELSMRAKRSPAFSLSVMTTRSGATDGAEAAASTSATRSWGRSIRIRLASVCRCAGGDLSGLRADKNVSAAAPDAHAVPPIRSTPGDGEGVLTGAGIRVPCGTDRNGGVLRHEIISKTIK